MHNHTFTRSHIDAHIVATLNAQIPMQTFVERVTNNPTLNIDDVDTLHDVLHDVFNDDDFMRHVAGIVNAIIDTSLIDDVARGVDIIATYVDGNYETWDAYIGDAIDGE